VPDSRRSRRASSRTKPETRIPASWDSLRQTVAIIGILAAMLLPTPLEGPKYKGANKVFQPVPEYLGLLVRPFRWEQQKAKRWSKPGVKLRRG